MFIRSYSSSSFESDSDDNRSGNSTPDDSSSWDSSLSDNEVEEPVGSEEEEDNVEELPRDDVFVETLPGEVLREGNNSSVIGD